MNCFITFITVILLWLGLSPALRAVEAERTLKLEADDCCVPLLQGILVDPLRLAEVPKNQQGLDRLTAQIEVDRKALPKAENKIYHIRRIAESLVVKAIYWQLRDDGSNLSDSKARSKAQQELLTFAPLAIRSMNRKDDKQNLLFPVALTQYLVNPKQGSMALGTVSTRDSRQADLLDFLKGFDQVSKGNAEGIKILETKAARIGKKASIAAALIKARMLSKTGTSYRSELLYASRLCQDLNGSERDKIFRFSMGVWTKAQDFKNQWEPVPFQVACYEQSPGFASLLENLAIYAKSEGRLEKAAAYYADAVSKTKAEAQKADLSSKLADTHRQAYARDGKRETYQSYLIFAESQFHSLPQGVRFLQMHDDLIRWEIAKKMKLDPKPEDLRDVRSIYDRYITAAAFSPAARRVRADWVELLVKHKAMDEAVDSLLSLAKGSSGIVREKYLRQALTYQTGALAVDLEKPWSFPETKDQRQLVRLADIMDLLAPFNKGQLRFAISRGRVSERLGLSADARTRFKAILPTAPDQKDRNELFTNLLLSAIQLRDYADVEGLIDLSLKQGYRLTQALPENKTLSALYIETIVYQVHDNFAHSRWALSRLKSDKVLTLVPDSSLRLEMLYLKARAFQNERKFNDALVILDQIERSVTLDETWKQSILDKAALQIAQGNLESGSIAYELYLLKAPQGDRVMDVKKSLIDLYLGMDRLAEARRYILELLKSDDIEGDQQIVLSDKLVTIHKKMAQDQALKEDIAFIKAKGFESQAALAQLMNLSLKRNPAQPQDSKVFTENDRSLGAVGDFISETAFEAAKIFAISSFVKVQESYKSSKEQSQENLRTSYKAVAKEFAKACDVPSASHCAPAMSELGFEAKRYAQWLADATGTKSTDESRELKAYFEKEEGALSKQLADAISRGNNKARWLNAFSRENSGMWRYIGLGSQNGVSRLDIPQQLQGQNSLSFSQGLSQ
jgi:hypothetical protein